MDEFFIARHGQSEWNAVHRIQGQSNTKLSPQGLKQSQELYQALLEQPLTDIYTSDLDRTIRTAQPLADYLKIPIKRSPLLNELDFGDLVGKYLTDLNKKDQEIWDWWMADQVQRVIPGGESYQNLLDRIKTFLDELGLVSKHRSILIVGHMRANQVLLGRLTGLTLEESLYIRQPNSWLYHIQNGTLIEGGEIPTLPGSRIRWQPGLMI